MSTKKVILFDDDADVRDCWQVLSKMQRLDCVSFFASWEDFLERGHEGLVHGAVAFVDNNFEKAMSSFSGIDIAQRLRELGVEKIFSISSDPTRLMDHAHLFDAILGTKFPEDVRKLVGE